MLILRFAPAAEKNCKQPFLNNTLHILLISLYEIGLSQKLLIKALGLALFLMLFIRFRLKTTSLVK